jgi:UDPglucose--hexose-1-phosphate uridylyltransferase
MPELRQNIITREWVVIARERARRPDEFARPPAPRPALPPYDPSCPFCAGNEHLTERESFRITDGRTWAVRTVLNKYPALSPEGERVRTIRGIHRSMTGVGVHEVVIEHPRHDTSLALLPASAVADVLRAYRARYIALRADPRIEAIIIFKNHGEAAGTSIVHPHSQIAAMPIVPNQIRARMEEAIRYFDENGECIFCQTLKEELVARDRIVYESPHFVAFIPYAALSPFHLWIFPRRHVTSFDGIFDSELEDLATTLRVVLAKLHHGLGNPDYNFSIRSAPARDGQTEYFHWYLAVIPRTTRTAGFEIGSGMYINTTLPEESAAFLRAVPVPG